MTVFRDYSTYLQRIVRLERQAHDQCNAKKYGEASGTMNMMLCEVNALREWLKEQVKE
jgi:hypothetical protein